MKDIKKFILEKAGDSGKWVAIEITTKGSFYDDKEKTSQRVVSYDTYLDMKEKGRTKGYMTIKYLDMLSPICRSKDNAMTYIDVPEKKARKSKINKGNADYIVWCINSGKMNAAGRTKWDWNFWEEWKDSEIYFDSSWFGSFLMGAPGSLKVGDKLYCVDNDTQKKLPGAPCIVKAISKCNLEDFRKVFRETFPDRCKNPSRQFGRDLDGLPWQRMGQFYSIKGVAEEA